MEVAYTNPSNRYNNSFGNSGNRFGNSGAMNKAYWAELTPNEQAAATILDWTPFSWEENMETPFSEVLFDELTDIEKTAAKCLGYSKVVWDRYIDMVKNMRDGFLEREIYRNEWANNDGQATLNEYVENFKSNYTELDLQYSVQDGSQYFGVEPPQIVRQQAMRTEMYHRERSRSQSF